MEKSMKIAIIGAGAMGSLFGVKLSSVPENTVYLLDVWTEHVDAVNSHGVLMELGCESTTYENLIASTDAASVGHADLAIILVKSTDTKQAVESNMDVFGPETTIITLQNGLGNVELIREVVGDKNVVAGTTSHGAMVLGPGKIRHTGAGKTIIGELDGSQTDRIKTITDAFNKACIETNLSDDVMSAIWGKLLVNAGINALAGITKCHNGELIEHPELMELLELAVLEGVEVAEAKGIKLGFADPVSRTKEVCMATAKNKASMLQDILNNRKTEIDMINGAIVREGNKLDIATPINAALTNLIHFFEKQR